MNPPDAMHDHRYELLGLKAGHQYEARVSYSARLPAKVTLQLAGITSGHSTLGFARRRLLDTEKIVFQVSPDGSVLGHPRPLLLLSAHASSPHRDGPGGGPQQLVYNILVQELWLGVPTDTFPLISFAVVLLVAVILLLPWWTQTAVPALESFILIQRRSE